MAMETVADWRGRLDAGELSAESLARRSLDRMARLEPVLHGVLWCDEAFTLAAARRADARLRAGERGPMLGLPVALKDNFSLRGAPTSCGSRILEGYRPPYDATVVARLLAAGAVPVAKTALDEFAMGSTGEYCAFGAARNPWDPARVPGGSSSGSVVAVAAGYAPFALGSDTGGSVRLPAAFCGVTALRPTYGVLSRYGLVALASSLDQPGPVARDAAGIAAGLSVMAGVDPMDATSVDLPGRERLAALQPAALHGLRVGLPREYFGAGIEPGVRSAVEAALRVFEAEGAELIEISLPHTAAALDAYYLLCASEASSNLSRFDGVRFGLRREAGAIHDMMAATRDEGFGPEVKRRILLGAFCLSKGYYDAFYLKALKARALVARDFTEAFRGVDVIATPASPSLAFALGAKTADPLAMHLADLYSVATALAGLPCLSAPAGLAAPADAPDARLPVGLQLIGPSLSDVRLLEITRAFQSLTGHHGLSPDLAA
jgi:aspartyl-tRNA(Asn)/glutamyl-tRNA(Gln) amidotransferase subunit A